MFLKITRRGKVQVTHESDTQCWDKGWREYFYEASITCAETNLDNNGFIIDNKEIKSVVTESMQNHVGSCELMVRSAGMELLVAARGKGIDVLDLHLLIYPADCDPLDCTVMEYSLTGKF